VAVVTGRKNGPTPRRTARERIAAAEVDIDIKRSADQFSGWLDRVVDAWPAEVDEHGETGALVNVTGALRAVDSDRLAIALGLAVKMLSEARRDG
jgi:hypothetical protein